MRWGNDYRLSLEKHRELGRDKPTFSNTTQMVFNVQRAHHSSNTATNYGTRQSIPFYDMGLYEMTNIFLINSLETTNVYRELQYHSLLTFPEHLSSSPVFSGVRVTRSLVLYVCVVDRCLSYCAFSFGHCVVCSSSIYGFSLPHWYLQTPLDIHKLAIS